MKLSIIIVNYNVRHFLDQCLTSVRRAIADIDAEIWVVDNNSVDGSVKMLRDKFPEVMLIANKDNVGFSKANNQAILKSSGEYVLLLNPDNISAMVGHIGVRSQSVWLIVLQLPSLTKILVHHLASKCLLSRQPDLQ